MGRKPIQHFVDGRYTTVKEMAAELGVTQQQLWNQMSQHNCGLQTAVNLIRDNLALNNQGRADRFMVDGRWMTTRQAAEMLGVTANALHLWRNKHSDVQGRKASLTAAVEAYRNGQIKRGGRRPVLHRVGNKLMTTHEAATRLGIRDYILRNYMHKHHYTLAQALTHYERMRRARAEKAILRILGF